MKNNVYIYIYYFSLSYEIKGIPLNTKNKTMMRVMMLESDKHVIAIVEEQSVGWAEEVGGVG